MCLGGFGTLVTRSSALQTQSERILSSLEVTLTRLDRFKQLEQLVHATLEQEPGKRSAFLHEACHHDEELEREALSLLSAQSEASDFLENPAEVFEEGINLEEFPSPLLNQSLDPIRSCNCWGEVEWEKSTWPRTPGWNGKSP